MKRLALICPGRGSYTERQLGSLPAEHPWVARADELRANYNLPLLSELDRATKFDKQVHLRPANAAALIWLVSMLDAEAASQAGSVVCVAGNSMGWYTALAVSGALDFEAGFRLVQEMGLLQEASSGGGQLIYPVVGDDWRPDPEREEAVRAALASSGGEAFPSIDLGGYAVLAGTDVGVAHLLRSLPPAQLGKNRYPFKLIGHGPYHTPLVEEVSDQARARLARLEWRRPNVTLIDGRGLRFTPWSTDVDALREYTLRHQVIAPYDLSLSIRVVLREYAPDELVLPGPGNTLGAICGQVLIREGWRGMRERADFDALQATDAAFVRSMRR
jgi:[acyl-carrier-protein] S-malonyltransferase